VLYDSRHTTSAPVIISTIANPLLNKTRKIVLSILATLTLLGIGGLGLLRWSLHQVQPYYQEALATNAQTLRSACLRLESRVSALASMAQQTAPWEALFTDTDVNGWLAVALEEKFPGWLPETISDLRMAFTDPWLLVGFHYQDAHYDTVVTLRMIPYMVEADGLAIRLESAHAGALPIPLEKIVQACRQGASAHHVPLRWVRQTNRPIALLPIDQLLSTDKRRCHLKTVELSAGQLLITGSSEKLSYELTASGTGNDGIVE
jgi:hypothetical protein